MSFLISCMLPTAVGQKVKVTSYGVGLCTLVSAGFFLFVYCLHYWCYVTWCYLDRKGTILDVCVVCILYYITFTYYVIIRSKHSFRRIMEILNEAKNGVDAFDHNSAESEPIWMKSGELWAHCWGLALVDFGRDPHSSDSLKGRRNFLSRT